MVDLDKIRKGFEAHGCGQSVWRICSNCPYQKKDDPFFDPRITQNYDSRLIKKSQKCIDELLKDAYDLLIVAYPEPRVLTLDEIINAKNMDVYMEETCETQTHQLRLVETENESRNQAAFFWPSIVRPLKSYGKTWRCWTSRPTDEQREAVKWDEG